MKEMKVAVIGAGLMGGGIAQTCAQAGYTVINIDVYQPALDRAKATVTKLFNKKIEKGTMDEQTKNNILAKLSYSADFSDLKDIDLVIEAVPEKMDLKKDIFKKIDENTKEDIVIVSNTSGLSISEMASVVSKAQNVMGVHFFYPAPVMKLVELIKGIATSEET